MLSDFHVHTQFCDGKSNAEETVQKAIERGFTAIGFSSHGYTDFDLRYCMKDTEGYIAEINRLKKKYEKDIQIYLGIEEDTFHPVSRREFDYIIGSSHYFFKDGKYYPVDSNEDVFAKCIEVFGGDALAMTNSYYSAFCDYILKRKPDIIGHFDLLTKFDEKQYFMFINNPDYIKLAEQYVEKACQADCLFEVNTGAISRGYRTTPYPAENLLHIIKKHGKGVILTSDSHIADNIAFGFKDAEKLLSDIGFEFVYTLYNGEFIKIRIKN